MFKGTSESDSKKYTPKTGLAIFQMVAVNPSKAEIEKLIGREIGYEPVYDVREMNGSNTRPVDIWVKSEQADVTTNLRFYVGINANKSRSGNIQFINSKGQFKYAVSLEECALKYPDFKAVREAYEGEYELFNFIQRLIRYKPSAENADFLTDSEQNGITAHDIYGGNYSGLRSLIYYANDNNCHIGLVLSVKKKVDGEKVRFVQSIVNKPYCYFTIFNPNSTTYQVNKLKEIVEEQDKQGYPVTNDLFTYELQDFNEESCINKAPVSPQKAEDDEWPF